MKSNIEILAPAGSYDGMRAAMNAGCDAVYIGGSNFGARAFADNPDTDTLLRAIDEAHIRDKKLYLTVNTLLKEKELTAELYKFLEKYYLQGLDAVIVQDVGVMHFIHRHFPGLPIHASTQMTIMTAQGADLLKDYGVTRFVTARELSLKEIKVIRGYTDMEIETFVHGALCYCYSGQCLMSSIIGGRSGNRGRCAQPCRMPYQFYSDNSLLSPDQAKYLLSPKDINTLAILPDLIEAGIDSFKIEGRMKRPEYAAAVSYAYRKYVDLYDELGKDGYLSFLESGEFKKDMLILQDIYNRGGFSQGYGKTYHGKEMMSLYRPNHSGVFVGEVKEIKGIRVGIALKEQVNAQDILEIRSAQEEGYEFTVKDPHNAGDILRTNVGRRPEPLSQAPKAHNNSSKFSEPILHIGDQVYRTRNNELLDYLSKEYLEKDKKLGIKGVLKARIGERLSLTVYNGVCKVTAYQEVVLEAMKQPMTREKLSVPLEKTGDTPYFFEELMIEADNNIFIPVAWLNDIRREAIKLLQEETALKYRRSLDTTRITDKTTESKTTEDKATESKTAEDKAAENKAAEDKASEEKIAEDKAAWISEIRHTDNTSNKRESFGIVVSVMTMEQWKASLSLPEITAVYADYDTFSISHISGIAKETVTAGKDFYLILPHICRLSVYERLKKVFYEIIGMEEIKGFIVKNFEEIALLQSLRSEGKPIKEIILNYNMYAINKEAKTFWIDKGITHFTAPVELNYQELKGLGLEDSDIIVYGFLPLMVSTQCLFESTKGCRKERQEGDKGSDMKGYDGILTDRLGKKFFVKSSCPGCYNIIYNGQALALHKQAEEVIGLRPQNIRLDFCKETATEVIKIINVFIDRYRYGRIDTEELSDYTTGHYKRGVE